MLREIRGALIILAGVVAVLAIVACGDGPDLTDPPVRVAVTEGEGCPVPPPKPDAGADAECFLSPNGGAGLCP